MNKLSKMVTSVAAASVLASGVYAEESGVFVGLEAGSVGYGNLNAEIHTETTTNGQTTKRNSNIKGGADSFHYGITVGYKHFFTPKLGLRGYANFNHTYGEAPTKTSRFFSLFNYGVNVDFLGNFYSAENADVGGFIGLGLGANSLAGNVIKETRDMLKTTFNQLQGGSGSVSTPAASFDVALNVGLRANLAKHHGIEAVARVPFLPATIGELDYSVANAGSTKQTYQIRNTWNFNVRYTYSF